MSHLNSIFFTKDFHLFVGKFVTVGCKNFFGKFIGETVALENFKHLVGGFVFQGYSINILYAISNVYCPLMLSATMGMAVLKGH